MKKKLFEADAVKKPLRKAVRFAHITEHPVHLVYFFTIAIHSHYAYVAIVCLVVGILALIPVRQDNDQQEG